MIEKDLILGYKKDFFSKTGKQITIDVLNKWESKCRLSESLPKGSIIQMILDATGWTWDDISSKSRRNRVVFKKYLTYFILYHNGYTLLSIGKFFKIDHTTVIYAIKDVENQLEKDKVVEVFFNEIVDYLHLNHSSYKDKPVAFLN